MPMPTTRRGRFLHYRAKAARRKKWYTDRSGGGSKKHGRRSSLPKDVFGWPLQEPKVYPRYVQRPRDPLYFAVNIGDVKPRYKVWGVKVDPTPTPVPPQPTHHQREAFIGYQTRRRQSIPPLKLVPRLPREFPLSGLGPEDVLLSVRYPSGAFTYAYLRGWVS